VKGIPQGRYTKEFREEAVKLVTEEKISLPEAARQTSDRNGDGVSPDEEGTGRSKDGAGYIKKSSCVLCEGVAARYAAMKKMRLQYPIPLMRRVLSVSASGFYAWRDRPLSKRAREEVRLGIEIKAAHKRTKQTYGSERLQHDLAEHGIKVGIHRIKRIRKKLGIRCIQKRKFKATTDSRHRLPAAENLLGQQFKVYKPNTVWTSDITYVPTAEGWLYLAGHKDLFTGEIVGYAMGKRLTMSLISESLCRAVAAKRPVKGLLHHSDRGSQYCSYEYKRLLDHFGLKASMSGKGNCFDNAPMESFWGTLKQELVHHCRYRSRQEAIRDITEYIEIFYNRQRLQARLGFLSPAAYEQKYYAGLLAA